MYGDKTCPAQAGPPQEQTYEINGSTFRVFLNNNVQGGHPSSIWLGGNKRRKGFLDIHPAIEDFIRTNYRNEEVDFPKPQVKVDSDNVVFWECTTEAKIKLRNRPDDSKVLFRCHPNYHDEGPHYDWAILDFHRDEEEIEQLKGNPECSHETNFPHNCVPSKILAFIKCSESQRLFAICHPCTFRDKYLVRLDTVLTEPWQLDFTTVERKVRAKANLEIVDAEATIVDRCFVVEEVPGLKLGVDLRKTEVEKGYDWVILVKKRSLWGNAFYATPT